MKFSPGDKVRIAQDCIHLYPAPFLEFFQKGSIGTVLPPRGYHSMQGQIRVRWLQKAAGTGPFEWQHHYASHLEDAT
jgi:hypothetical protein